MMLTFFLVTDLASALPLTTCNGREGACEYLPLIQQLCSQLLQ